MLFSSPPKQSISELSQQGQAVGVYAQILRDFLRRMDTSQVEGLQMADLRSLLEVGKRVSSTTSDNRRNLS